MGLLKDFAGQHLTVRKSRYPHAILNPLNWHETAKYRRQRANRGWADRDAWNMGEHVAGVVVEMLELLQNKGVTDWDAWFEYNIDEKGKGAYKNLQEVIDDIKNYLEHEKTSWADDLRVEGDFLSDEKIMWFDEKGKLQTDPAIKHRMNKWHKENTRLYKKATKAMAFFGRHFAQFWD